MKKHRRAYKPSDRRIPTRRILNLGDLLAVGVGVETLKRPDWGFDRCAVAAPGLFTRQGIGVSVRPGDVDTDVSR